MKTQVAPGASYLPLSIKGDFTDLGEGPTLEIQQSHSIKVTFTYGNEEAETSWVQLTIMRKFEKSQFIGKSYAVVTLKSETFLYYNFEYDF